MTHTVGDLKWDNFWGDWGYDISCDNLEEHGDVERFLMNLQGIRKWGCYISPDTDAVLRRHIVTTHGDWRRIPTTHSLTPRGDWRCIPTTHPLTTHPTLMTDDWRRLPCPALTTHGDWQHIVMTLSLNSLHFRCGLSSHNSICPFVIQHLSSPFDTTPLPS